MKLAALALIAASALISASPVGAATYPAGFEERTVASGLTGPVAVAWTPDGRMLVTEKAGVLKVFPAGSGAPTAVDLTSRVNSYWDRGLLGLAVDSDFATNHYVYLLYTAEIHPLVPDGSDPAISRLARFELSATNQLQNEAILLGAWTGGACPAPSNTVDCIPSDGPSHSIGTVRSARDGTLYVGSGDSASFNYADPVALRTYNEQSMAGKILRVDRNGRGLASHPFCPADTNLDDVCTKVFAKGFRNPYRFKLRPSGGLAVGDVGWNTREEIDLISTGGKSYGWPCYEGGIRTPGYDALAECAAEYAKEGTPSAQVGPSYDYPRVGSAAILGGPTYQGSAYPSGYRDRIFFGDYAAGFLKTMRLAADGSVAAVEDFATGWTGTDIEADPNGDLVFTLFGDGSPGTGSVRRVVYSPGNGSPAAKAAASPTSGAAPLTVAFSSAGSSDPDGDPLSYSWDFGDGGTDTSANPSHTYTETGVWTATLTVSDGRGLAGTATVQVSVGGSGPTATILTPGDESLYRDGDTISFSGSGSDPEDGNLPASRLSWNVIVHHSTHIHQVGTFNGVAQGSFQALRDHDADSYYEINLRATDSTGLTNTRRVNIRPETVPFALRSAPSGAAVSYAGTAAVTPFTTNAAIGFNTTISAASAFTAADGRPYVFDGWSDGGGLTHNVTVPAAPTTLTASYLESKAGGRPATASSSEVGFDPRDAVDGNTSTRWSSAAADGQWWMVDLGAARQVSAVEIAWEAAYASNYEILTSLDGVNFSVAKSVALLGPGTDRATFAARSARYVRVRAVQRATVWGISFWEARVLGPADDVPPPPPSNADLALNQPASASSTNASAGSPQAANDGDSATRWSSDFLDAQWWQVDLGAAKNVDRVEVNWEAAYASTYRIQTSSDGTTFTDAASVSRSAAGLEATTFSARSARYLRLVGGTRATPYGISFWDFRAYGPATTPPPDTRTPETTIDTGPSGTTAVTSASFTFSSDEGGSTFECRLDTGTWGTCTSPKDYTGLAPGSHTFEVRAIDMAGNVDATPASRTWTVSTPTPSGDLALNRPASASSTDPSTGGPGAANDGSSSTRWSSDFLDAQWWQVDLGAAKNVDRVEVNWEAAYASTYRIQTSSDGTTFTTAATVNMSLAAPQSTSFAARGARYVRLVGDVRATPWGISFWDFAVYGPVTPPDTTPPDTTIDAGPTGTTASASASFDFSATEPGSTFECRLDGGAYAPCSSPKAYSGLANGSHAFDVRATDPAGNVDPTPASRSWSVDAPAGDLALNRPASASSTDPSTGGPGAANDGSSSTRWSSNFTDNQWWQVDLGAVRNVDRVEVNWEAAYASTYRIQTSSDGTTFTTAATVSIPSARLESTTFPVRSVRYVRLIGDTRATPYGISFWDFRAFGPGGAIDTTLPDTTIGSGPTGTTTVPSASFEFSSTEAGSSFECRLDGGAYGACSSPKAYSGLANGSHSFEVRATDPSGNVDATPASRTWTIALPTYAERVAATAGLVNWWRLEDTGSSAADGKGTNTGTYVGGPASVAGLISAGTGSARDFDGVNDLVDLTPAGFGTPSQFSVETWVRIDTQKTGAGLHFLVTDAFSDMNDGFSLLVDAANRPQFYVARSDTTRVAALSSVALTPGAIYHLVATYDGSTARLYVNGVQRAAAAYTGGITYNVSRELALGSQNKALNRAVRWLDGRLDEVALYSAALAPATVLSHYDDGK
jgi:glucose/arabinose dehydrogenase